MQLSVREKRYLTSIYVACVFFSYFGEEYNQYLQLSFFGGVITVSTLAASKTFLSLMLAFITWNVVINLKVYDEEPVFQSTFDFLLTHGFCIYVTHVITFSSLHWQNTSFLGLRLIILFVLARFVINYLLGTYLFEKRINWMVKGENRGNIYFSSSLQSQRPFIHSILPKYKQFQHPEISRPLQLQDFSTTINDITKRIEVPAPKIKETDKKPDPEKSTLREASPAGLNVKHQTNINTSISRQSVISISERVSVMKKEASKVQPPGKSIESTASSSVLHVNSLTPSTNIQCDVIISNSERMPEMKRIASKVQQLNIISTEKASKYFATATKSDWTLIEFKTRAGIIYKRIEWNEKLGISRPV